MAIVWIINSPNTNKINKISKAKAALICAPGTLLIVFFIAVLSHEWYQISIIKNPVVIAEYHFGSEAMIGEGGEKYRNPNSYTNAALLYILLLLPLLLFIIVAWIKRSLAPIILVNIAFIVFVTVLVIKT
jgi:hypothetical protein